MSNIVQGTMGDIRFHGLYKRLLAVHSQQKDGGRGAAKIAFIAERAEAGTPVTEADLDAFDAGWAAMWNSRQ